MCTLRQQAAAIAREMDEEEMNSLFDLRGLVFELLTLWGMAQIGS